jgi:formylglycine-generating enzyme required for sulfatase activity
MKVGWFLLLFLTVLSSGPAFAGDMALIPAGPFQMGSPNGELDEAPVHPVYLSSFYMDRNLVTNAEYAEFLNTFGNRVEEGKKWLDNVGPLSSWLCKIREKNGRFTVKRGYENHPVIKVSWYGARAYARWQGKRLPTEAEWEKAARGGLEGQTFVYGTSLTNREANVGGFRSTTPVGYYPPNELGLYDMVASVWQWCSDWYDPEYYRRSPGRDPAGPESGSLKVLRGGSWFHRESWRVANRLADDPLSRNFCFVTGFRCAKDESPVTGR